MTALPQATAAAPSTAETFRLAEGPRWDGRRDRLLWVDIVAGRVLQGRVGAGGVEVTWDRSFDQMTGAVAVTVNGDLLVAGQEGLLVVRAPDGEVRVGPRLLPPGAGRRLNDGATDPAGRFLVGSLSIGGPTEHAEQLFRVHPDGRVDVVDSDLSLSNGLAWSVDGTRMYSTDTLRGIVWERPYDATSGAYGARRIFVRVTDGFPDGCAVDAEDHLWVAHWGIGEVRRYAPEGTLVSRVEVDAPNASAVALAGPDLRTLVVTTASVELEPDQLAAHPDSGRLFTVRVDVPGLLPTPAKISWATP